MPLIVSVLAFTLLFLSSQSRAFTNSNALGKSISSVVGHVQGNVGGQIGRRSKPISSGIKKRQKTTRRHPNKV